MSGVTTRLGDIATFVRGITFKPNDVVPVGAPGSVACMRTKNVQAVLELSDVWSVPESLVKRAEQYLQPGDVLVSSANSWNLVGKCCWVPDLPWRATLGGFISALRGESGRIDARYLFHWFRSPRIQATVRSFAQQTTNIANLNIDRCLDLSIPLPPLAEQRRVVEILDKADTMRAKRRAALVQLDTLTQSIFLGMFSDTRKERMLWPTESFEKVVRETKLGLVRSSQEFGPEFPIPYVRMNAIGRNGELDLGSVQRTHATEREVANCGLEPGDLLFNTRNSEELVGKTALYRGHGLHVFNNNVMRIRFTAEVHPEFVAAAFRTSSIQHELGLRKSGTTNVFAIYYKDLRSLPFPVPPISLQREFACRVSKVEQLKSAHRASLAELQMLFSSLQHRAFRAEL